MLVTPEQMKFLEEQTDASGVSYGEMMERAGKALAAAIMERRPEKPHVLFLAGSGNNGGDCYVAAYHLQQAGWMPEIVAPCGEPETYIARAARDRAQREGIPIYPEAYPFVLATAAVVVDGLYGTGFHGEIGGAAKETLKAVSDKYIVACDVPSGGSCLTGQVSEMTLPASLTVTFGAEKLGMSQYPLREMLGELVIADIGIPEAAFSMIEDPVERLTLPEMQALLPERRPDAYKNVFGHLLAVVGSENMRGAAVLAVEAAMRAGTGLVTCASCKDVLTAVVNAIPEALLFDTDEEHEYSTGAFDPFNAVLFGCGVGKMDLDKEEPDLFTGNCPYIIDADGLNSLVGHIDLIPKGHCILTPHPGEAARLLGLSPAEVQADRPAAAKLLAKHTGSVVVLKGAGTIVTDGRRMRVCNLGNPGMAKAGSGDVLAGITASFAAQGMDLYDAACAAVTLHAAAGDVAAEELGQRFMLPQDIILALQEVLV